MAITTPQDEFNYFSELMALKSKIADAGLGTEEESLFDVTQLGMCCEACKKAKLACNHKLSMNPHWKPPERVAKVDAMYVMRQRDGGTKCKGVSDKVLLSVYDPACLLTPSCETVKRAE